MISGGSTVYGITNDEKKWQRNRKNWKLVENIKIKKKKKNTKENYISPGKRQKIIDDLVI